MSFGAHDPLEGTFVKFEDGTGRQMCWDASSLGNAARCQEYYRLNTLERYRWKADPDVSRNWGKAVHMGLEEYDIALVAGAEWDEALWKAVGELQKDPFELGGSKDNTRTVETSIRAIMWYAIQFQKDVIETAVLEDGTPAIEVRFEVPLPDSDFRISGRIDKLAHIGGMLHCIDRKTTKKTIGPYYFRMYDMNAQILTYLWALSRFLDERVYGFMIEVIQAMVGGNRFGRNIFNVTEERLQEFERDMLYWINNIEEAHATGKWIHNWESCGNYGGCVFRDVCRAGPSRRHRILNEKFEVAAPYKGSGTIEKRRE